ncbi:copper-binding protein [Acidovorax sp. PRC11]|jgi:Cu/Ag efflux protein CusF|uniref:copper-binding protein n=1 Tax=Comamonadaceae TaxID=80864 RepID=UPI0028829F07|nr:copper-binding protein [Acidovorax sp. PRC11]MDT0136990.1 copper-binding protein [Acidovorax sp. PRC11]
MRQTHRHLAAAALSLAALIPAVGMAQAAAEPAKTAAAQASMTDGEVRKIDKDTGKITLKHGDIKHLEMPGMTMVFTAKDKALLDKVQVGDKVRFMAASESGKMVVTAIEPAK